MADYTKLGLDEVKEILSLYSLGEVTDIAPQGHGISNSNYKISLADQEPVLLKVSNDKSYEELEKEQIILKHLSQSKFQLALTPVKTKEERLTYQIGPFTGVVYPFIEGSVPEIGTTAISQIAQALAQLHNVKVDPSLRAHTEVGFDFQNIYDFVHTRLECPADFQAAFDKIFPQDKSKKILAHNLESSLIHGDLYYDNCMFYNNELVKMIDFEQSGLGPILLDIGISISGSCLRGENLDNVLIDKFIKSYQHERKIQEIELLNDYIHIGLFSIALWRIKRFLTGDLDPLKKYSYQQLITRSINFEHSS